MLVLLLGMARAACTFQQSSEAIVDAMDRAEAAYAELDVAAFEQATVEVDYMVRCLDAVLSPADAARLHRLRGIGYHVQGMATETGWALRAARAAAPDWQPPPELFPEGFELRDRYLDQPTTTDHTGPRAPRPRKGEMWQDGLATRRLSDSSASLVQIVVDERVHTSTYLLPRQRLPPYPGSSAPRDRWLATGLALVATSGALYGLASASGAARYQATDLNGLKAVQLRTNALVVSSGVVLLGATIPFSMAYRASRR